MIIANEDIKELRIEVPDGHGHLRTTMVLHDGGSLTFQEAAIANLVRAYITVQTHPTQHRVHCPAGSSITAKKALPNGSSSRSER